MSHISAWGNVKPISEINKGNVVLITIKYLVNEINRECEARETSDVCYIYTLPTVVHVSLLEHFERDFN